MNIVALAIIVLTLIAVTILAVHHFYKMYNNVIELYRESQIVKVFDIVLEGRQETVFLPTGPLIVKEKAQPLVIVVKIGDQQVNVTLENMPIYLESAVCSECQIVPKVRPWLNLSLSCPGSDRGKLLCAQINITEIILHDCEQVKTGEKTIIRVPVFKCGNPDVCVCGLVKPRVVYISGRSLSIAIEDDEERKLCQIDDKPVVVKLIFIECR